MPVTINQKQVNTILLVLLNFLVGFSVYFPSLIGIAFLLICFLLISLFLTDELFKLAPVFLFFNTSILYVNGFSIVNIFFLIYILKNFNTHIKMPKVPLIFLIFFLYVVFIIGLNNFSLSIEILISLIFLIFLLKDLFNCKKWDDFCFWYIVSMTAAIVYGVINLFSRNMESGNRLVLAFTDPNYAGMFLSIGLYILIFKKKIFNSLIRWILIVVTICSIFLTISSTALLCNILIFIILLFDLNKMVKLSVSNVLKYTFIILSLLFFVYVLVKLNPELSRIFERFLEKLNFINNNGLSQATTGRSDIWIDHMNFFFNQKNIFNLLFGGNYLTDRGFDTFKFSIVSHQVYIDSLITFGLIGTTIYIIDVFKQLRKKFINRTKTSNGRLLFIIAFIWFIYSFGLSMFPFWGFILFLFVNVREEGLSENKKFS